MNRRDEVSASLPADTPGVLSRVFDELDIMHTWRGWHWWPGTDPFEVCVGAILVQNASWTNVERALETLRRAGKLEHAAMAACSATELEDLVRSSGQFRQKARKLRAFLDLVERCGSLEALLGQPADELRAALLATWGIGPETADAIILYAAHQPAFAVDAYAVRIFSRLGLGPGPSASYDDWQRYFTRNLARDVQSWSKYRALIVLHAKHLCRKRQPRCTACRLRTVCHGPGGP